MFLDGLFCVYFPVHYCLPLFAVREGLIILTN